MLLIFPLFEIFTFHTDNSNLVETCWSDDPLRAVDVTSRATRRAASKQFGLLLAAHTYQYSNTRSSTQRLPLCFYSPLQVDLLAIFFTRASVSSITAVLLVISL